MAKTVRFLHCADLHIDTPFRGLAETPPGLRDLLGQATYRSFCNIVELAIQEQVDCVLVAGDAYDSADRSLHAQLRFAHGLQRLSDAGIPSFVVHGNRDPLDSRSAALEYPANTCVFEADAVQCFPVVKNGEPIAEVYGISFPTRKVNDNLASGFRRAHPDLPAIGLLHASVDGAPGHETCAACSSQDLQTAQLDYWALGHVHAHAVLRPADPAIVYPGSPQATALGETGQKGCCLVTLEPGADPDVRFVPTDLVRFESGTVDVSDCLAPDEAVARVRAKCQEISSGLDGRHAVLALSLTGETDLRAGLHPGADVDGLLGRVREHLDGDEPWIWLERLDLNTQAAYDPQTLGEAKHLVADIASVYHELQDHETPCWQDIGANLGPLFSDWPGQRYLEALSQEDLLELASAARDRTLAGIVGSQHHEDTPDPY